jgi:malate/lactate dehydrogenase
MFANWDIDGYFDPFFVVCSNPVEFLMSFFAVTNTLTARALFVIVVVVVVDSSR